MNELSIKNPEIPFHPWADNTGGFVCNCTRVHAFGEPGTIFHRPKCEIHTGHAYVMIMCPCGIWHGRRVIDTVLEVHNAVIDGKSLLGGI